jgi:hypothetical protein
MLTSILLITPYGQDYRLPSLVDKLNKLLVLIYTKWCSCGADEEIRDANSGHVG